AVWREVIARIQAAQLIERARGQRTAAIGGAVECVIVEDDDLVVAAVVDVQFERIGAQTQPILVGGQRVLRGQRRAAPVREEERPRVCHKRQPWNLNGRGTAWTPGGWH